MIVEGAIAVKAALNSKYRKVERIFIDENKHNSDVSFLVQAAYHKRVKVERPTKEMIDSMARGKTHGGILADVTERRFQSITSMLMKPDPLLFLVEGVEDSYNLGYIIRSLYAFGCDGLILPMREWDFEDGTMVKSSAGASELLPIHLSEDLTTDMEVLRQNNMHIYSAFRGDEPQSIFDTDFSKSCVVCVGGPLRGLSAEVLNASDTYIYIPYANDFKNALNASSAATILAAELYRQRHAGGK